MPQRVFKTRQVWQPQAGSVRLRGRSVHAFSTIAVQEGTLDLIFHEHGAEAYVSTFG